jgi:hypothetical protein
MNDTCTEILFYMALFIWAFAGAVLLVGTVGLIVGGAVSIGFGNAQLGIPLLVSGLVLAIIICIIWYTSTYGKFDCSCKCYLKKSKNSGPSQEVDLV